MDIKNTIIADPWIDPSIENSDMNSKRWKANYSKFKSQLYWNIIFEDLSYIQDSFFLFNRQFECFLNDTKEYSEILWSGDNPVFSCAKRNREKKMGLMDIYNKEVLNNKNFIWYWDGIPSDGYIEKITNLIDRNAKNTHYGTENFYESLKKKIELSFEPSAMAYQAYASHVPNYLKIINSKKEEIKEILENKYFSRSSVYRMLKIGLNKEDTFSDKSPIINNLPLDIIRRVVDDAYRHNISQYLDCPGYFPNQTLAPDWFNETNLVKPINNLYDPSDLAEFNNEVNSKLANKVFEIPHFEFHNISELPIDKIWRIRKYAEDYRNMIKLIMLNISHGQPPYPEKILELAISFHKTLLHLVEEFYVLKCIKPKKRKVLKFTLELIKSNVKNRIGGYIPEELSFFNLQFKFKN